MNKAGNVRTVKLGTPGIPPEAASVGVRCGSMLYNEDLPDGMLCSCGKHSILTREDGSMDDIGYAFVCTVGVHLTDTPHASHGSHAILIWGGE